MNKLEQAARQALEALEAVSTAKERGFGIEYAKGYVDPVITALREALAEPVRKCDGLLCNECGEYKQRYKDLPGLTEKDLCICALAEQAEQEPVGVFANVNALTPEKGARWEQMIDSAYDGVEYIHLYAAPQPVKQEPVDFVWVCNECDSKELTSSVSEDSLEYCACSSCGCNEFHKEIITAPVRTKDLTDEDLCKIGEAHALGMECEGYENNMLWYEVNPLPAFRAVIAADREKNK